MSKPWRQFLWAPQQLAIACLCYLGMSGHDGAVRIVAVVVWLCAFASFGAMVSKDCNDVLKQKGRTVPAWLCHGTGVAFIVFFLWEGWGWTAAGMLIHEISLGAAYNKEFPEKPNPETPKPDRVTVGKN